MTGYLLLCYIIRDVIRLLVYLLFVLKACESKLRYGKKCTAFISAGYIAISVAVINLFLESTSRFAMYEPIAGPLWVAFTFFFMMLIVRLSVSQLLFFVLMKHNISLNVMLIAIAACGAGGLPFGVLNYSVMSVLVLLAMTPLLWYLFVRLAKRCIEAEISMSYWHGLYWLPLTYFAFFWFSMRRYMSPDFIMDINALFTLAVLIAASFLSYIPVLKMLIRTQEGLNAQDKINVSEQVILMLKEQYKQMSNNMERTDRICHDFRHHVIAIRSLADAGDLSGLLHYLDRYQKSSFFDDIPSICKNHLVDVMLRHYIARAKASDISICVDSDISETCGCPEMDLCVVLGNLFENALESCERQENLPKFMEIKIKAIHNKTLAISVKNSYEGTITQNGSLFVSNKRESMGIGVATIRAVARQNGGDSRFEFEEGVFSASVLLKAPPVTPPH